MHEHRSLLGILVDTVYRIPTWEIHFLNFRFSCLCFKENPFTVISAKTYRISYKEREAAGNKLPPQ